ncbi:MAG: aldo/keto reductase [Candidatus Heimdallarchaeota archaeon]|nr:aldo/keto reductase [Candidatus Heimdallarchaeota archaeon]
MKYAIFGPTGITVSRLCLGMMSYGNGQDWMLEIDDAKPFVDKAIDLGINFFDTANVYSRGRSEEITGELLKGHRDDVVIASKVRFAMGEGRNDKGLNRYHMTRQIKASLTRLQIDFIDLYQIHRWDYNTDIELVMRSLNHLIDQGKVSHIGASSMYAWELAKAQHISEQLGLEKFVSMQNHYNAMYREEEREVIPFCLDQNIAVIPWSPLARGFLSGKYKRDQEVKGTRLQTDPYLKGRYFRDNDFDIVEIVEEIAKQMDVTSAQVALSWLLHQPGVTSPIIGATKLEHLQEAADAVELRMDSDHLKRIDEVYIPRPVTGHSYLQPDAMVSVKK